MSVLGENRYTPRKHASLSGKGVDSGEIILSPDLEDEEGPELMAVVSLSLKVGIYHPLDLWEMEITGLGDTIFFESRQHQVLQLPSQPVFNGDAEAFFFTGDVFLWEKAFHALFEKPLGGHSPELEFSRQVEHELDDLVVDERHPCFQRCGHAHAVDFDQDIVNQIGVEIQVELG